MQISRDFRPTKYVTKYRKTRQTKYQALLRLGVGNGKFERVKGLSSTFLLFFPTLSTQEKPKTQTKKSHLRVVFPYRRRRCTGAHLL